MVMDHETPLDKSKCGVIVAVLYILLYNAMQPLFIMTALKPGVSGFITGLVSSTRVRYDVLCRDKSVPYRNGFEKRLVLLTVVFYAAAAIVLTAGHTHVPLIGI